MKNWKSLLILPLIAALAFGFSAAPAVAQGHEDGPDIVDIAVQNEGFSTLVAALQAADLVDVLAGEGPFTVFAPTNQAFGDLLNELGISAADLLANEELLTEVLLYHVVPGSYPAADALAAGPVATVQGGTVTVSVVNGVPYVNDSSISRTDIITSNGVIHVIDKVLLPPADDAAPAAPPASAYPAPYADNIVDIALANEGFSTLVAALQAADLVETLNGEGPFTVFAPTNQAFADLLAELGISAEELLANEELLTQVLLYHVAPGRVFAADAVSAGPIATVQGGTVNVTVRDGMPYVNDASISRTDINTANGVIHVIDAVLLPGMGGGEMSEMPAAPAAPAPFADNIVDIAVANEGFSTLVAALQAADLVETLNGEGPFTVFAPTNQAFADLLAELGMSAEELFANEELLTDVLLYHVVPGRAFAADVVGAGPIATVQGSPLSVTVVDGVAYVNDASISRTDINTANGVIHVIDAVILPPMD